MSLFIHAVEGASKLASGALLIFIAFIVETVEPQALLMVNVAMNSDAGQFEEV